MKNLNDKRSQIWTEIVEHLSLKQLSECMGDNCRTWVGKATKVQCVSRSKRVHTLAKALINEVNRIAIEFTWFQGIPLERTALVEELIHAHVVATQEYDHESVEEIEDYLHELKYCPSREDIYTKQAGKE